MKKIVLFAFLGIFAFSSCNKTDTVDESPILGLWYYDTSSDTKQYLFTEEYKDFCQSLYQDSVFVFDESLINLDWVIYGYWDLSSDKGTFFYQYKDGSCDKNTTHWSVNGGTMTFGATKYELVTYNEDYLAVRLCDTTYYFDENHQKKVANLVIKNYTFVRDLDQIEPADDPWGEPHG